MITNYRSSMKRASKSQKTIVRSRSQEDKQGPADGRGDWQSGYEHYRRLAESFAATDLVVSEQYWQRAEHFRRLINGSDAQTY
jgi:hypothetical protein